MRTLPRFEFGFIFNHPLEHLNYAVLGGEGGLTGSETAPLRRGFELFVLKRDECAGSAKKGGGGGAGWREDG